MSLAGANPSTEALNVLKRLAEPDSGCATAMATHLHRRLPELERRSGAGTALDETRSCCQAHLELVARVVLRAGRSAAIEVPEPAIEHARSLVRRGVSLHVLLRAHHLGQAFLCARATSLLEEQGLSNTARLRATVAVDAFLFEYIDGVSDAMAAIYGRERENWRRSPEAVRAEALQAILEQRGVDERLLEQRLGYDLTGHHMAFVLTATDPGCSLEDLGAEARRIAAAVGANASLILPSGGTTAWAWCRTTGDQIHAAALLLAEWQPAGRLRIGFADPAPGVSGFRTSHLEALEAVALAGRFPGLLSKRGTTTYRSVELLSLLIKDRERAARFMRSRLGPLMDQDQRLCDLRTTALGFLQHNRSHARAGEALFLHRNTVFSRIKQVEKLLERRSDAWGIEVEAALLLASILETEPRV